VVEQTWFKFSGTVPLLFGLLNHPLDVDGAQIVDADTGWCYLKVVLQLLGSRKSKYVCFKRWSSETERGAQK
jgi:hypothetical protein